jgi:hypothetical protein
MYLPLRAIPNASPSVGVSHVTSRTGRRGRRVVARRSPRCVRRRLRRRAERDRRFLTGQPTGTTVQGRGRSESLWRLIADCLFESRYPLRHVREWGLRQYLRTPSNRGGRGTGFVGHNSLDVPSAMLADTQPDHRPLRRKVRPGLCHHLHHGTRRPDEERVGRLESAI